MDTSGFDIQFDNHIPENGYRIEGYLCNANNAKECQAIMVRSEPFHQIDYSAMGNYWISASSFNYKGMLMSGIIDGERVTLYTGKK